jgi:hypothetical protein
MKLAISYFIGVVMATIVVGFMKDPLIAFCFFMAVGIITSIITGIVVILSPQGK